MQQKRLIALAVAGVVAVLAIGTFAWFINNHDWGIALMLLAPLLVWAVIRLARRLDDWSADAGPR